jgi:D-sedoheptulose 7-phosphate isomerase
LKNFLSPGDIVIGISVSGNSKNIIKAIDYANNNGATTIGFCGFDGGKLKKIAKYPIHVKVDDMKITEDIHSVISHILMKMLSKVLIKQKS